MIDPKVGRLELVEGDRHETIRENVIKVIKPGDRITNMNPGGGGYGNPMERSIDKVLWDVKNGLVSVEGAKADYGVIVTDATALAVDISATEALRATRRTVAAK